MTTPQNRNTETIVYILGWVLIVGMMMLDIMRVRSYTTSHLLTPSLIARMLRTVLPYFTLFLINNYLLIPRLLMRNRMVGYLIAVLITIGAVWTVQGALHHPPAEVCKVPRPMYQGGARHLFPFPRFLDFIFDLLIVGINLAIALIFQRYNERLDMETRQKADAESRLNNLKAQIHPHFYMNMLNNIHGMIEIDAPKAQEMILDMSKLMRYILYDSTQPMVPLSGELDFMHNYLSLMRLRYPEDKVDIQAHFPSPAQCASISVPPLLMPVYLENAFKHGISYRRHSFVRINISVADGKLTFDCVNSLSETAPSAGPGIGLRNARQRLHLIYGDSFTLTSGVSDNHYQVTLTIPANDNQDYHN